MWNLLTKVGSALSSIWDSSGKSEPLWEIEGSLLEEESFADKQYIQCRQQASLHDRDDQDESHGQLWEIESSIIGESISLDERRKRRREVSGLSRETRATKRFKETRENVTVMENIESVQERGEMDELDIQTEEDNQQNVDQDTSILHFEKSMNDSPRFRTLISTSTPEPSRAEPTDKLGKSFSAEKVDESTERRPAAFDLAINMEGSPVVQNLRSKPKSTTLTYDKSTEAPALRPRRIEQKAFANADTESPGKVTLYSKIVGRSRTRELTKPTSSITEPAKASSAQMLPSHKTPADQLRQSRLSRSESPKANGLDVRVYRSPSSRGELSHNESSIATRLRSNKAKSTEDELPKERTIPSGRREPAEPLRSPSPPLQDKTGKTTPPKTTISVDKRRATRSAVDNPKKIGQEPQLKSGSNKQAQPSTPKNAVSADATMSSFTPIASVTSAEEIDDFYAEEIFEKSLTLRTWVPMSCSDIFAMETYRDLYQREPNLVNPEHGPFFFRNHPITFVMIFGVCKHIEYKGQDYVRIQVDDYSGPLIDVVDRNGHGEPDAVIAKYKDRFVQVKGRIVDWPKWPRRIEAHYIDIFENMTIANELDYYEERLKIRRTLLSRSWKVQNNQQPIDVGYDKVKKEPTLYCSCNRKPSVLEKFSDFRQTIAGHNTINDDETPHDAENEAELLRTPAKKSSTDKDHPQSPNRLYNTTPAKRRLKFFKK